MRRDDGEDHGRQQGAAFEIIVRAAAQQLTGERCHAWTCGDLASEVWLRMRCDRGIDWLSERSVQSAAARTALRLVLDHGRHAKRRRRGGRHRRAALTNDIAAPRQPDPALTLSIQELLQELAREAPRAATCLASRHHEGLSDAEIAVMLGCSVSTVERAIRRGLDFLRRRIGSEDFLGNQ